MPVNINVGVKSLTPYTARMNELMQQLDQNEQDQQTGQIRSIRDTLNNFNAATNVNRTPTAVEMMSGIKQVQQPQYPQTDPLNDLQQMQDQTNQKKNQLAEYQDEVAKFGISQDAIKNEIERQNKLTQDNHQFEMDKLSKTQEGNQAIQGMRNEQADKSDKVKSEIESSRYDQAMAALGLKGNLEYSKNAKDERLHQSDQDFKNQQAQQNHDWRTSDVADLNAFKNQFADQANTWQTSRDANLENFKAAEAEKNRQQQLDLRNILNNFQSSNETYLNNLKQNNGVTPADVQKNQWSTDAAAKKQAADLNKAKVTGQNRPNPNNRIIVAQMNADKTDWDKTNDIIDKHQGNFGDAYKGFKSMYAVQNDIAKLKALPVGQTREIEMSIRNAIAAGRAGTSGVAERQDQYINTLPGTTASRIKQVLTGQIGDLKKEAPEVIAHIEELVGITKDLYKQQAMNALQDLHINGNALRGRDPKKQQMWAEKMGRISSELNAEAPMSPIDQARRDYQDPNVPPFIKQQIKQKFGQQLGL